MRRLKLSRWAAVVGICQRLGGIPLALELAAAGLRVLDPPDLLAKLEEGLELPGPSDLPARQRTLRATLDWSYTQLDVTDETFFRRLGVFSGSFSLQAAEAVAGATPAALDRLATYSLCSLERTRQGPSRYAMLRPVAHYARSLLSESESESSHRSPSNRWSPPEGGCPGSSFRSSTRQAGSAEVRGPPTPAGCHRART